jgi:ATP-dependent Zn protease
MENVAGRSLDGNYLGATEEGNPISDETKNLIDTKVRKLLNEAYDRAKKIINANKELHEKISQILMKKQEMLQDEFDAFFEDMKVPEKVLL